MNNNIPKIIWIYWHQGWDNATEISKLCLESWIYNNKLWKVIPLSKDNINLYLDLDKITDNFNEKKPLSCTVDILNINLLNKYGGIWVDATVFCYKPLDLWLSNYTKNGLFMYKRLNQSMILDTWFIASSSNNYVIEKWCDLFTKHWLGRKEPDNYFDFYHIFKNLYNSDKNVKNIFDNIPTIDTNKPHILQKYMYTSKIITEIKFPIDKYEMFKLRNNKCIDNEYIKSLLLHKYNDIIADDNKMSNNKEPIFIKYLSNYTGFPKIFLEISKFLDIPLDTIKKDYLKINNDKYVKWTEITDNEFKNTVVDYDKNEIDENILREFYSKTQNYMYELAEYHSTKDRNNLTLTCINIMKNNNIKKVLDFGCGIGQDSIIASMNNLEATACDIDGTTLQFARWRFSQRNLNIPTISIINNTPLSNNYDAITCFEVIMHVPNPEITISHLYDNLKMNGLLFITWRFVNNYSLALKKNIKYNDNILDIIKNVGFKLINKIHMWGPQNENGKYLHVYKKYNESENTNAKNKDTKKIVIDKKFLYLLKKSTVKHRTIQ